MVHKGDRFLVLLADITHWVQMRLCRFRWYRMWWVIHCYYEYKESGDHEWNKELFANLKEQSAQGH